MNNPEIYSKSNECQRQATANILERLVSKLQWNHSREVSLDIGCGTGDITKTMLLPLLPKESRRLIGIDKMSSMIEYARQHYSHEIIDYHVMDILNFTDVKMISEEKFSKVFSFFCFHWIKNYNLCLKNIFEIMEEDGQALFLFLTSSVTFEMLRDLSRSERWKKYIDDVENFVSHYHDFDGNPANDFGLKATEAGFLVQYCETKEIIYDLESAIKSKEFFAGWNPFLSRIPPDEREEYLKECFDVSLRYHSVNSKGGVQLKYNVLEVLLLKDKEKKKENIEK